MKRKGKILETKTKKKGYLARARDYIVDHRYSILAYGFSAVCMAKGTYDIFIEKEVDTGFEEYKAALIALGAGGYVDHAHERPKKRDDIIGTLKNRYDSGALYKAMKEMHDQSPGYFEGTKQDNILQFLLEQSDNLEEHKKIAKSIIDDKYGIDVDIDKYADAFMSNKSDGGIEDMLELIQSKGETLEKIADIPHIIFEMKDQTKIV